LTVESLESRSLLSVSLGSTISGTIVCAATQNGTPVDQPVAGVTVDLYKDGGDNQFEGSGAGDDTLWGAPMKTLSDGTYSFNNVPAGTYFVQEVGPFPTGVTPVTGQDHSTVVIASGETSGQVQTVIDSFNGQAEYTAASRHSGSTTGSVSAAANEALGGNRNLSVKMTTSIGNISLGVNADVPDMLDFATSSAANGVFQVDWDGANNNPATINPTGLSPVNLKSGAAAGIELTFGADHDGETATLTIYSSATNYSTDTVSIPNTGDGSATGTTLVKWTDFSPGTGAAGAADFTKATAVQLQITGTNAADGQLGTIATLSSVAHTVNFTNAPENDLAIVKTASVATAIAGGEFSYTLATTNNGPWDATGVTIADPLPAGLQYVKSSGDGTVTSNGGVLSIALGNMTANTTKTTVIYVSVGLTASGNLINTATVSGKEPDYNPSNNSSTVTTPVGEETDLAIVKTGPTGTVVAGTDTTYSLTTTNNGPSNATGVTVTDTLPTGLHYVSSGGSGSVSPNGNTLTITLGALAAHASVTTTITVSIDPDVTGNVVNAASVTGKEPDLDLSNNQSSVTTPITPEIDLAITKSADQTSVKQGANLTYTLTSKNNGPSDATNVTVTDTLPAGVQYVSAGGSGSVTNNNGVLTVTLGALAVGATDTTTIVVSVDKTTTGTLTNQASIQGKETDTNLSNNQASCTTPVTVVVPPQDIIDLGIKKAASLKTVGVGGTLTYTLTINNYTITTPTTSSTMPAQVIDTLPAGLQVQSVSAPNGTVATQNNSQVVVNYANIPMQGQETITVVVTVTSSAASTITNTATVEPTNSSQKDTYQDNNTASVSTAVVAAAPPSKWYFLGW
jgi:uncharacterized repeat protein (TIGR01451 family)